MKIEIDTILCKAYANCTYEAPDIFAVSDATGKVSLLIDDPSDDRRDDVEAAVDACPVQALRIAD